MADSSPVPGTLETYRQKADASLGAVLSVRRVATRFGGSMSAGAVAVIFFIGWIVLRFLRGTADQALFVASAVGCGVVGWAISWVLRRAYSVTVVRHEHGLSIHHARESRSIAWSEFASVRLIPRKDTRFDRVEYTYVLREGGRDLTLPDDYPEREAIATSIEDALLEKRLPSARETLDAGSEVRFGDVEVGPLGIRFGDRIAPWQQIVQVQRTRTVIDLLRADGKLALEVDLEDVPNPRLFVALVEHRLARAS